MAIHRLAVAAGVVLGLVWAGLQLGSVEDHSAPAPAAPAPPAAKRQPLQLARGGVDEVPAVALPTLPPLPDPSPPPPQAASPPMFVLPPDGEATNARPSADGTLHLPSPPLTTAAQAAPVPYVLPEGVPTADAEWSPQTGTLRLHRSATR